MLGRASSSRVVLSDGRPDRADCGLDVLALMTDDKLFVAECPRTVDNDVSVSDEIVESGRMYSTLSEKPTRALDGGLAVLIESSNALGPRREGCEIDLLTE